jgi:regulator of replication initiation timing
VLQLTKVEKMANHDYQKDVKMLFGFISEVQTTMQKITSDVVTVIAKLADENIALKSELDKLKKENSEDKSE